MIKKLDNLILKLQTIRKRNMETKLELLFNQAHGEWIPQDSRIEARDKYSHLLQHYQIK